MTKENICKDCGCERRSLVHYARCVKEFNFEVQNSIRYRRQILYQNTGIDIR